MKSTFTNKTTGKSLTKQTLENSITNIKTKPMNYQLSESLKDAGFPFQEAHGDIVNGEMNLTYITTLEELIKECFGNELTVNGNFKMREIHGFWEVSIYSGKKGKTIEVEAESDLKVAVAKLWLKLNL